MIKSGKKQFKWLLTWIFLSLIFLTSIAYLMVIAQGYKINWQTLNFQKTGILFLSPAPENVDIYLNGELQSDKRPLVIKDLFPGYYDIKITAVNRQNWSKSVKIESGKVVAEKDIKLWKSDPKIEILEIDKAELWKSQLVEKSSKGLMIYDNEIWRGETLITRFSRSIKIALWFPDYTYLLVQLGQEVRAVSVDGSIDHKLFNLSSNEIGKFFISSDGSEIIYLDGKDIKSAKIF